MSDKRNRNNYRNTSSESEQTDVYTKKKIGVLFGGCSPEYDVSLQSAHAVITQMNHEKYIPVPIGITPRGDWYSYRGTAERIKENSWQNAADCIPLVISPSPSGNILFEYNSLNHANPLRALPIDAVFPVLHGKNGEDGTVQGLFELTGIPIVGCRVLSCALCMDKEKAHKLVWAAGVPVPRSTLLSPNSDSSAALLTGLKIGYPLFVKPVRAGSSFGITKVMNEAALLSAVKAAFQYDDQVILEENISGFEVGCSIMGNDTLTVGRVDEIELSDGFFDYTEKYSLKTSAIHVPARISADTEKRIRETAKLIYRTLGCEGFARVNLLLTDSGHIVFNEVNAIPGFTAHSRFPNMLMAAGLSFPEILDTVIDLAVRR